MDDTALQNAIQWNLRRRDEAKRKGDRVSMRHFQANLDRLRSQIAATLAPAPKLNHRPRRVHPRTHLGL